MKNLIVTVSFVISFLFAQAQTATILFINNNSGATSLDLEVLDVSADTTLSITTGIKYLGASSKITVPSTRIVNLIYKKSGTSEVYYTQKNVVFTSGEFRIPFLAGTSGSKRYSVISGSNGASSSTKIRIDFAHTTLGLQDIDLRIRELDVIFADNFKYNDKTFTFSNQFDAADYTLDIMPYNNNNKGLFAYTLPGSTIRGEYVYLFTAGTKENVDMYMVQMTGTVTKLALAATAAVSNELENKPFTVFPNPATTTITILEGAEKPNSNTMYSIYNMLGEEVLVSNSNSIDISVLNNGTYYIRRQSELTTYTNRFIVAR
jgi:hypothetical protein